MTQGVFCVTFARRKKNRSGTTGVVVVDKSNGKFRELKTIRQRLVQTRQNEEKMSMFWKKIAHFMGMF